MSGKGEILLNAPAKFFGAYIVSFNTNIGWGQNSSSCSITLVEDPSVGAIFNPPPVGTACKLVVEKFTFGGIFVKWDYRVGVDGKFYEVQLESPSQILDNVYVVLSDWIGNEYKSDANVDYPASGPLAKIPNVINLFGYKEHILHGGKFGGADLNSVGYPAASIISDIPLVIQGKVFGDRLAYAESTYDIDLSELAGIIPEDFRITAGFQSLTSIINIITEIGLSDYIVYIKGDANSNNVILFPTIKIKLISRKKPANPNVIKELITSEFQKSPNDIKVISYRLGKEIADIPTQKALVGGSVSRTWFAQRKDIYPIWGVRGIQENTEFFYGSRPAYYEYQDMLQPILVTAEGGDGENGSEGNWNTFSSTVLEIRCAASGRKAWAAYHTLLALRSNLKSVVISGIELPINFYNQLLNSSPSLISTDIVNTSVVANKYWADLLYGYDEGEIVREYNQALIETRWKAMLKVANQLWGKKYLVHMPMDPGGVENNFRWIELDRRADYSWDVTDSAWVGEDFKNKYPNSALYDDRGRLKNQAFYPVLGNANYSVFGNSYELLNSTESSTDAGQRYISDMGGASVDKTWGVRFLGAGDFGIPPENYFDSAGNSANDSGLKYPMVAVDINQPVFYRDSYTTEYNGFISLLRILNPTAAIDPVSYVHTTGFENIDFPLLGIPLVPSDITIGQQSSRLVYGPWYDKSPNGGEKGKLIFDSDPSMVPEAFGNWGDFNKAGDDYVKADLADLFESEDGFMEKAELPQWNIGDKLEGTGPYITSISVAVSTDRITTTYQFHTWSRKNGALAKWNIEKAKRLYSSKFLNEKKVRDLFRQTPFSNLDAIMKLIERKVEYTDVNDPEQYKQQSFPGYFGTFANMSARNFNASSPNLPSVSLYGSSWNSIQRSVGLAFNESFGQGLEQVITPVRIPNPRTIA